MMHIQCIAGDGLVAGRVEGDDQRKPRRCPFAAVKEVTFYGEQTEVLPLCQIHHAFVGSVVAGLQGAAT